MPAWPADMNGTSVQLQALGKEICQEGLTEETLHLKTESATALVEGIPFLDLGRHDHRCAHSILEAVAVKIWNHAITLKKTGLFSSQYTTQLRHLSCILEYRCNASSQDEEVLKKLTMMALKTGRAWLDNGDPEKAELVLQISTKIILADLVFLRFLYSAAHEVHRIEENAYLCDVCIEKLQTLISSRKNSGADVETEKMETQTCQRDKFKLLCCKAEAAVMQKKYTAAMDFVTCSKQIVLSLPKEGAYLSMLCYNFGVEAFQQHNFKECIAWLQESYDTGKDRAGISPQNQGRTLRLMANSYLELKEDGHLQKALDAITLASAEHCHHAGLYLKLKVFLLCEEPPERIRSGIEEILEHPDVSLELGLNTVALLSSFNRRELGVELSRKLQFKFTSNADVGKVYTQQLEILLQEKLEEEARQFTEEAITAHYSSQPLDLETRKRFHLILWQRASELFEEKCPAGALQWYNFSLSLFTSDVLCNKNLCKLHRNRVSCYLLLNKNDKAEEAALEAEKADAESPYTQYTLFKVAVALGNAEKAKMSIKKMCINRTEDGQEILCAKELNGLICLAVQLAFEREEQEVALVALEGLVEHKVESQTMLTALRSLIRLQIKEKDDRASIGKIIQYLNSATDQLQSICPEDKATVDIHKESSWLMKIAWNTALKCEDYPEDMKELYKLCSQFTSLCGEDAANMSRQRTCLMMITAAGLQLARQTQDANKKREVLEEALLHLGQCKRICEKIRNLHTLDLDVTRKDTTEILLLLFEFEAKINLGDPEVESVLEKALSLPQAEPKTYETIAALAMESPAQNRKVGMRALKAAIRKHVNADPMDLVRLSKTFHSLIQLALQAGGLSERGGNDEAFSYYTEVLDVMSKAEGAYPEIEALWLMTKAWNQGINLFSTEQYVEAEKWCGMSMTFLKHLPSMLANYESLMNMVYSDILSKIEQKKASGMEE